MVFELYLTVDRWSLTCVVFEIRYCLKHNAKKHDLQHINYFLKQIININGEYWLDWVLIPDWKTYFAKDCINVAGQVGGDVSSGSLLRRKVNSKPKPDTPSGPPTSCTLPSPCKSESPKLLIYINIALLVAVTFRLNLLPDVMPMRRYVFVRNSRVCIHRNII